MQLSTSQKVSLFCPARAVVRNTVGEGGGKSLGGVAFTYLHTFNLCTVLSALRCVYFASFLFPDPDGAEMPVGSPPSVPVTPHARYNTAPHSLPSLPPSLGPPSASCSPTIRVACLGWLASERDPQGARELLEGRGGEGQELGVESRKGEREMLKGAQLPTLVRRGDLVWGAPLFEATAY